jgi:methylmalonyl-CoA epimerase|tara:strand:- start:439 stop:840 length:402 start_codon:yes stop_codon:yes gene_type:complete
MNIIGIEHVGIGIKRIKNSESFWNLLFKNINPKEETIRNQNVKTKIYNTGFGKVELLEDLNNKSSINKFLKNKNSAMHHISFQVENIEDSIVELKKADILFTTEDWSIGAEGYKVIFIHPRSTGGVLVELTER